MREIMSFLFDRITDPLGLPIEAWKEWIILGIIGLVAYIVAFRSVGDLYDSGMISSGTAGRIAHWIIRFFVFVPIWAVTYGVIAIGKLVIAHWGVILCVLGACLLVAGVIGITVIVRTKEGRRASSDST